MEKGAGNEDEEPLEGSDGMTLEKSVHEGEVGVKELEENHGQGAEEKLRVAQDTEPCKGVMKGATVEEVKEFTNHEEIDCDGSGDFFRTS